MTKAEKLILNYQRAYTDPVTGVHSPVEVEKARKAILAYRPYVRIKKVWDVVALEQWAKEQTAKHSKDCMCADCDSARATLRSINRDRRKSENGRTKETR